MVFRFIVVGGTNTLIDLCLYFVFANLLNIHPAPASILSTGITMMFSFMFNYFFVFKSQKKKRHTIIQFFAVTIFNVWGVQSAVILAAVHILDQIPFFDNYIWTMNLLAKLSAISVSMVLNFLMYKKIFTKKEAVVK